MEFLETKVCDFFNEWLFSKKEYNLNAIINTIDLDKEDAIMIFEEFLNKFEIESGYSNFDTNKYFYKLNFLDALLINIFRKKIEKKYVKKPSITIAHMVMVAKRKEWFDPLS